MRMLWDLERDSENAEALERAGARMTTLAKVFHAASRVKWTLSLLSMKTDLLDLNKNIINYKNKL
jgi:hypothetical protein